MPPTQADLADLVHEANEKHFYYHTIPIGDGLLLDGLYDLRKYAHHYRLPEDLSGKKCLDVGTATGFFAFEMERRGADSVTAIDVFGSDDFRSAHELLGSKVDYVQKSVYDLDADFGQFDVVFCGSMLMHVPDLLGALRAIRSVCKGQAYLSTAILDRPKVEKHPYCYFVGDQLVDETCGQYWSYWYVTMTAFERLLKAAGFARSEQVDKFHLASEPNYKEAGDFNTLHGVMHAFA